MLALYPLFSGTPKSDLLGLEPVFDEAARTRSAGILPASKLKDQPAGKMPALPGVRRVVIVGNKISPGQPQKKDDGTVVNTLWGELAWQLGGKEGYAMVKQADETATNPGDILGKLLKKD